MLSVLFGVICVMAIIVLCVKIAIAAGAFFIKYAWLIALVAFVCCAGMCASCYSGPTDIVVAPSEYVLNDGEHNISLEIKELGCELSPKDKTLTLTYTHSQVDVFGYTLDSEDGRVFVSKFNKSGYDVQITMVLNPTSSTTFTADLEIWVGCVFGECRDLVEIVGD